MNEICSSCCQIVEVGSKVQVNVGAIPEVSCLQNSSLIRVLFFVSDDGGNSLSVGVSRCTNGFSIGYVYLCRLHCWISSERLR